MLNLEEYLLICLVEECAEVQQRATKMLRFGVTEVEPGQPNNNVQRLHEELNDLHAILDLLESNSGEGIIYFRRDHRLIEAKIVKVRKFIKYSQQQGTLEPYGVAA